MVSKLFLAKFLEILMTGSLEIGKLLRGQSVSIFRATAHALHLTWFLGWLLEGSSDSFRLKQTMCKSVNVRFSLPFYFCLFLLFKSRAGFYTTPLTAQKLCSATLITWLLYSLNHKQPTNPHSTLTKVLHLIITVFFIFGIGNIAFTIFSSICIGTLKFDISSISPSFDKVLALRNF